MPARDRVRPIELAAAALVIAVAACLRITRLDLMEFKFDEATALGMALDVVDGRSWPMAGLMSSVGVHNPPVLIYLLAVLAFITRDPVGVAAGIAVISTVAVALTYAVVRPRFGSSVALGSSLLFATSPWAVVLGRKIWAQDLVPILCVLLLYTLYVVIERHRSCAAAAVPLLLTVLAGLHFSAVALAPAVLVVIVARRREMNWVALGLGCGLALLLIAPYVLYLAGGAGHDMGAAARLTGRSVSLSLPSMRIIRYPVELTGTFGWRYLLGESAADFSASLGGWRLLIISASFVTAASVIAGLSWLSWSVIRAGRDGRSILQRLVAAPEGLLLIWMGSIWIAALGMRLQYVHPHYFAITYPVSFVVAALAMERGARRIVSWAGPLAPRLASAVIVIVSVSYGGWMLCFLHFISDRGGTAGDYGEVYRDKRAVVDVAHAEGRTIHSTSMPELPMLRDSIYGGQAATGARGIRVERTTQDEPPGCHGVIRTFGALEACIER